jgi:hypothetical protein
MTTGLGNSYVSLNHTADRLLQILPPKGQIDPYAAKALKDTESFFREARSGDVRDELMHAGFSSNIVRLSQQLNNANLEDIPRLLLSSPDIYASLILTANTRDQVPLSDLEGLYNAVLYQVNDVPKRYFLARLLTSVLNAKRIRLKTNEKWWDRLDDLTLERGLPIQLGQVEPAITELLSRLYKEGSLPTYLTKYIQERSGIPETAFTPSIQQGMINYLTKLGVQIKSDEAFSAGLYDEYFALAYNEALKQSAVTDDPIDTARIKGGQVTWDFNVDNFDALDVQGVTPANIKAAGALDYIFYIGEGMRVFDVANALVLRWAGGMLDIPEGKTAAALYRFHKLRNERNTSAERAMLYRRVLNKGNGKLLSNMVANHAFPRLWHQLMAEVAEYIRKSEGSRDSWVSRASLYQATKNLQYNLTEHMTGMSHVQVAEDYAHLQEALDILRAEEIMNNFGGRRKSLWSVVERVAKEDLGTMIPTSLLRTIAVEGNKVFQWTANFEESAVQESEFNTLLSAAEAWIIAQASMESQGASRFLPNGANGKMAVRRDTRMKETAKPKQKEQNDDFDDWDV